VVGTISGDKKNQEAINTQQQCRIIIKHLPKDLCVYRSICVCPCPAQRDLAPELRAAGTPAMSGVQCMSREKFYESSHR